MKKYVIALDQGTTSSRAIVFDDNGNIISMAQHSCNPIYPQPGWVEHDPMEILATQARALEEAFDRSGLAKDDIAAIGITNQRETTVVWDKTTGKPFCNAIVWQCRRTAPQCEKLQQQGLAENIKAKTGLVVDAYFSATKIQWILENIPGVREKAERGEALFGTVESWLIWNLTGKRIHLTDYSNASRTMLFNIHSLQWDQDLCRMMDIPMEMLPKPVPNAGNFGSVDADALGLENLKGVPICGALGDQQASLLGQGCISPGDAKNTYGTGCFTMMNTGLSVPVSEHGLLSCVAWQYGGKTSYCLEGSVFNAGSTVQWLRDQLGLINSSRETEVMALSVPDNGGVYLVSAFTGMGAPYWDMYARGTICGLTRGTKKEHIVRAALEGIAYQVRDLITAMEEDSASKLTVLRVDGGASVNEFLMQFQADMLRCAIDRPAVVETTALGAAFMAGLYVGVWDKIDDILAIRREGKIFRPVMPENQVKTNLAGWKSAVEGTIGR